MSDQAQFVFTPADLLRQRLESVLERGEGPYPLPPDARKLLQWLSYHRGASRAIQCAELAKYLKVSEREIKALAKCLVEDFDVPIGASRQKPYGYFLIETAQELEDAMENYIGEIRSLARRVRKLGGKHRIVELAGQLTLEPNNEEKESA